MKKIFLVLLTVMMCLTVCLAFGACNGDSTDNESKDTSVKSWSEAFKVGEDNYRDYAAYYAQALTGAGRSEIKVYIPSVDRTKYEETDEYFEVGIKGYFVFNGKNYDMTERKYKVSKKDGSIID